MFDLTAAIQAHRSSNRTLYHAYADNFAFDGRVGVNRQTAYRRHPDKTGDGSWDSHHRAYVANRVNVTRGEVPDTFLPANADCHRADIDGNQSIIRLEEIDWVLKALSIGLDKFVRWIELAGGKSGAKPQEVGDACDALDDFVEKWNARRDSRPIFAGFEREVMAELERPDWPNLLRDRWGLGHYDPPPGTSIPVLLMRYDAKDVIAQVRNAGVGVPFAYPTAYDAGFGPYFFPAPAGLEFGRAMDLQSDANCDRHIAEILHRRIDYRRKDIWRPGAISAPRPAGSLRNRRNEHLLCLQYHIERDDFGQAIPDHVAD